MRFSNHDVVIVGGGAAGMTAAIGLARSGFDVAVLEAAEFAGAANGLGGVYPCEHLAHPDILGPDAIEALAWERRLVERGTFLTDGFGLLGMTYRDPVAFRNCYTVLRPIFDRHVAQLAARLGVTILTCTTAESLIRHDDRVVGVATNRGPFYADLVFLAEGGASPLVMREGYERSQDPRYAPQFLQEITQFIELPPGAVERLFGIGPGEGIAYDLLLRNGLLEGRSLHLNMSGVIVSNREGLSVGLVVPVDHLRAQFEGHPEPLLDWFLNLPALAPWLQEGRRGALGTKLVRGGGYHDVPHLVDNGLAIGGGASAVGSRFPARNFIGPATAMGLLLSQAARRIREEGGGFTRAALERHYLGPLRQTHYWRDLEFLRRWPRYLRRTEVLFNRDVDLALGSAYVWTRPRRWLLRKGTDWFALVRRLGDPAHWSELQTDFRRLRSALRSREVAGLPALGRLLLDGALNSLRDLVRKPRAGLPAGGTIRVHCQFGGAQETVGNAPLFLRRWFRRFAPVLAAAAREVYADNARPLASKLQSAVQIFVRQLNVFDVFVGGTALLLAGLYTVLLAGASRLWRLARRQRHEAAAPTRFYAPNVEHSLQMPLVPGPPELGQETVHTPLRNGLPVSIQLLGHPVTSPSQDRLLAGKDGTARSRPQPRDAWQDLIAPLAERLHAECRRAENSDTPTAVRELTHRLDQLERKLHEFEAALAEGSSRVDRNRADYLERIARYAQQLAVCVHLRVEAALREYSTCPARAALFQGLRPLAALLVAKLEERTRRTWDQRYVWAVADGRQVSQHHLVGLRTLLGLLDADSSSVCRQIPDASALALSRVEEAPAHAHLGNGRTACMSGLRNIGRDTIGTPGFVKRGVPRRAVCRFLMQALDHDLSADRYALVQTVVRECFASCARPCMDRKDAQLRGAPLQYFPGTAYGEVYRSHGQALLEQWDGNGGRLADLPGEAAIWDEVVQRQALLAELEQITDLEFRLRQWINDWRGGTEAAPALRAEVEEQLGRQDAWLLAAKVLVTRTHRLMEEGRGGERHVMLTDAWLENVLLPLEQLTDRLRNAQDAAGGAETRPVVEPLLQVPMHCRPVRPGRVPRHPMVFCHGMLAMTTLHMQLPENRNYFHHLEERLRERGIRALFPQVEPTGGVERRARQLREQILRWTNEPINLVAHSMGGLDCRFLITHLGFAERARSLTTVSTPHRGSPVADWFCANYQRRIPLLYTLEAFGLDVDGVGACRLADCRAFNASTPDAPGARYFSYGAAVPLARMTPFLRRPWNILTPLEGPNDGLVSVTSAQWGEYLGTLEVDHFAQTPDRLFIRPGEDFDSAGFFLRMVEDLARRGL